MLLRSTSAVSWVVASFGRVDALVNCAGIACIDPAAGLSLADWDATFAVNLRAAFLCCQELGRHLLAAGRGQIVNIASQVASVALEGHAAYCASKAGLVGLTRVLAIEWGGRGVTVNAVSPTVVLTDLGRSVWAGEKGGATQKQPAGRSINTLQLRPADGRAVVPALVRVVGPSRPSRSELAVRPALPGPSTLDVGLEAAGTITPCALPASSWP